MNIVGYFTYEIPQRQCPGHNLPLGHHTDRGPMDLVHDQYNSPGEYLGHNTASPVFLNVLILAQIKTDIARKSLDSTWVVSHNGVSPVIWYLSGGNQEMEMMNG